MNNEAFLDFVRTRKSCITDRFDVYLDSTEENGLCEAAHVRRAGPSGIAHKPDYSAVPLTHEEHDLQHRQGELACLLRYLPDDNGGAHLRQLSYVEQFDAARDAVLNEWLATLPCHPADLPERPPP
jgi:hypothetical protein